VWEELDSPSLHSFFDSDNGEFVEDSYGSEDDEAKNSSGGSRNLGEHVTKEDLIACARAVEHESPETDEEGFDESTDIEFAE